MTLTHPLVAQLRFTRSEFNRSLKGLSDEEASQRFGPMNCISWNVGHLAWQEQQYFLAYGQGQVLLPAIHRLFASGAPASAPALRNRRGLRHHHQRRRRLARQPDQRSAGATLHPPRRPAWTGAPSGRCSSG
jgi:hypothetical protein